MTIKITNIGECWKLLKPSEKASYQANNKLSFRERSVVGEQTADVVLCATDQGEGGRTTYFFYNHAMTRSHSMNYNLPVILAQASRRRGSPDPVLIIGKKYSLDTGIKCSGRAKD